MPKKKKRRLKTCTNCGDNVDDEEACEKCDECKEYTCNHCIHTHRGTDYWMVFCFSCSNNLCYECAGGDDTELCCTKCHRHLPWSEDEEKCSSGSFLGFLPFIHEGNFNEILAKLITCEGDSSFLRATGNMMFEWQVNYKGELYSLYDFQHDYKMHIGGNSKLTNEVINKFKESLKKSLKEVEPTEFTHNHTWENETIIFQYTK